MLLVVAGRHVAEILMINMVISFIHLPVTGALQLVNKDSFFFDFTQFVLTLMKDKKKKLVSYPLSLYFQCSTFNKLYG